MLIQIVVILVRTILHKNTSSVTSEVLNSDSIKSFSNLQDLADTILDEDSSEHDQNGRWPFHHYVEQLVHDIFDPSNCPSSS